MDESKENQTLGKRLRNPNKHFKSVNRLNREKGLQYQTIKKRNRKTKPNKTFTATICKCRMACHLTEDENSQKQIFQHFYSLLSWSQKTEFIKTEFIKNQRHIEISQCKIRRKPENRKNIRFRKSFGRHYFFSTREDRVCKSFFKKVLQISEGRIENCVKKLQNPLISNIVDLRGQHESHRKTPTDSIKEVIAFINLLPQYESHYTREQSINRKYLSPDLSHKKIYDEYLKWCNDKQSRPISKYMFRDVFYRKFNLKFKPPLQDTCNQCNILEMKIKTSTLKSDERIQLLEEKENHVHCVENIMREYREYKGESKLSGDRMVVLVYDLEKVFETPKLSTNCAFYKRKLSMYNLCIHDDTHNRSYMYTWHEAIASRGPPEITSCLLYHFDNFLPSECEEVITYSDSCGGQNRNIKTSTMLSHYLENNDQLKKITQHFYRSGHSYNVCDRKFGIIERSRRKANDIFVPKQWKELIENSKTTHPKFIVTEMNEKHFLDCEQLIKMFCTKRTLTTNKEKLNWLTFRKIEYRKGVPLHLFIETYDDINIKYDESHEFPPDVNKILSVQKRKFNSNEFVNYFTVPEWKTDRK